MRRKIIGIFVCTLLISCSTTTFAFTPFSRDEQQTKNQFYNMTPVPLLLSKRWMKMYGGTGTDVGRSVQQTRDGGYIITGLTGSFGVGRVWLIKINKYGNEIWNKTFEGGTGYSIEQTTDDGYIITGSTMSFGTGGDVWLIKTDSNGDEAWNRTFRRAGGATGNDVQQTTDSGYIITGTTLLSDNNYDVLLVKTDINGNKLWEKTFGRKITLLKYRTSDMGWSVQQTHEGGYVIVGSTETYIFINKHSTYPFHSDVWLIKTNRFGIKLWDRIFRGLGDSIGYSVDQTIDRGYIITGSVFTQDLYQQMLLIKTNNHGKIKPLSFVYLWLENLFERFPNAFPLLRQLIRY